MDVEAGLASGLPAGPDRLRTLGHGLRPEVLREVVRRAHSSNRLVWAHVETGADVRLAAGSGVDALAYLPTDFFWKAPERYELDSETVALMGQQRMIVAPTASLLPRYTRRRPARLWLGLDRQTRTLRRLHKAGARIVLGADWWWETSATEANYLAQHHVFPLPVLLRMSSETTPQAIFPERAIGRLAPGYEASFLALTCNPVADWSCTSEIQTRTKQGLLLTKP